MGICACAPCRCGRTIDQLLPALDRWLAWNRTESRRTVGRGLEDQCFEKSGPSQVDREQLEALLGLLADYAGAAKTATSWLSVGPIWGLQSTDDLARYE